MWNRILSGSFVVAVCLEAAVLGWANAATTHAPGSADRNAYRGKKQGYAVVQNTQDPAQPPLFEFFEYRDAETGAGGHIRLSLKFGKSWAVESPWRHSSTSIIAQPKVYVRAVFQNTKHSDLAGSLRIVPDLAGVECIDLFLQLAKIDGYEPLKLSDTPIDNIPNGRLAVGTFFNKKNDLAMGTKILCAEKTAVQLIVAAPNKDEFSAPVNAMVLASDLFVSVERKP